jgi:leucyl-tRNA synthetase
MAGYDHQAIERKWQKRWEDQHIFHVLNPGESGFDASKPKLYVLDMFPYPSGEGLHVGHLVGYIGTDIFSRYHRMRGANVLHPMGFDSFGLPAEQYAVETGVHPRVTTERNEANYQRQMRAAGLSYDWDRMVSTTDPNYYRWTQWIFLRLFDSWFDPAAGKARPIAHLIAELESGKREAGGRSWSALTATERREFVDGHRLAYLAEVTVSWCRSGRCWRTSDRERHSGAATIRTGAPEAVDAADHRLCRPPDRRPGDRGLAGVGEGDAGQLDRTQRGRRDTVPSGRLDRRGRGVHHPP